MSTEKSKMEWGSFIPTAAAVLLGMAVYGLLDRFVLSKIANHLENLIEDEE